MIRRSLSLLTRLEKSKTAWALIGFAVLFFLFRLPSLFEPHWYGDEGIYQAVADSINSGKLLYKEVWDNKPPLLYLIYALFDSSLFAIRAVSLLFGLVSLFLFYHLARIITEKANTALITTAIFTLLYAPPVLEGNIANAENFIMLFVLVAAILLCRLVFYESKYSSDSKTARTLLFIGILTGIAFLFKIVAIFDFAAFFVFLYIAHLYHREKIDIPLSFLHQAKFLLAGFLLPFLVSVVYFFLQGTLAEYISGIFFNNVGYVNYRNQFFIP